MLCPFFKFEHPDDILPDMECGFETCDHGKLREHIRKEHPNIGLESAQDLFRELWESQREGVEGEIVLEQGYGNETCPETVLKNAINIS